VVNGIPSERQHEDIEDLWFTDNGKHYAYTAKDSGDSRVYFDGEASGPSFTRGRNLSTAFSRDGEHICYNATRSGKGYLVVDGVESQALESSSDIFTFGFKGPGADAWYLENLKLGERVVCVGGKVGPIYDNVSEVCFGHHTGEVSYTTFDDDSLRGKAVVKGVEGPEFEIVGGLVSSEDHEHIAYRGYEDHQCVTVVDGEQGPWFDDVIASHNAHFAFDKNGNVIYYGTIGARLVRVVHRWKKMPHE
jgi:hypothetical protein